jgi:hypothetical protein
LRKGKQAPACLPLFALLHRLSRGKDLELGVNDTFLLSCRSYFDFRTIYVISPFRLTVTSLTTACQSSSSNSVTASRRLWTSRMK